MRTFFKIGFLEYLLIGLGAACFAQVRMPPTTNASPFLHLQNTNVWKAGEYTLTNQPSSIAQVSANPDSDVVGFITAGTNIVAVSGSEPSTTSANGLTEIVEADDVKLTWNPNFSILWSPDLVNWYTVSVQGHVGVCFPNTNQMFFKLL